MPKFADNTHGYQIFNGTEAKYIMKRYFNSLHTDSCIYTHIFPLIILRKVMKNKHK